MNLPDIKQRLNNRGSLRRSADPLLYDAVLRVTDFLPPSAKIRERIYVVTNDITQQPTCIVCGKPTAFLGPVGGYRQYCSTKCSANCPTKREKVQSTNIAKFGAKTPAEAAHVRERVTRNLQLTYGPGVTCTQQVSYVKAKTHSTNMERYGTKHSNRRHLDEDSIVCLTSHDWLYNQHIALRRSMNDIALQLSVSPACVKRALEEYNIPPQPWQSNVSYHERQLMEYVQSVVPNDVVRADTSLIAPHHVDIVVPSKQLAIEFNGLYWHSDTIRPDKNYHVSKTDKLALCGYKLIHVFENEWVERPEVVKSRIRSALGVNDVIYGRKCVLASISHADAKRFCDENHIQGSVNSAIQYGLFFQDRLVAVMTFGKARFGGSYQYELLRYCSTVYTNVVGGASRLFTHFVKMHAPESVVSYCDRRWGTGDVYGKMGFIFDGATPLNYWYFDPTTNKLHSRIQFQKHKLAAALKIYDPALSEGENMRRNGYHRVWDCGQFRYVWRSRCGCQ